jgi:DNA-nicking Smr family endonuclease
MRDVQPLRRPDRAPQPDRASEPTIAQRSRRDAALGGTDSVDPNPFTMGEVPVVAPLEVLEWKKEGVQPEVFSKLRKGGYEVEAELDLHGLTVKEARATVWGFLGRALASHRRCLLIAHGRGERSPTPARLKSYLHHWLVGHPDVIALVSAQAHRGGTGALYVLLRKSKDVAPTRRP